MIKVADIWAKKVAAEKRADAYSSLAKIIMKNPAKWGVKAEGLARPALQHEARLMAFRTAPVSMAMEKTRFKNFDPLAVFRTTEGKASPFGVSGVSRREPHIAGTGKSRGDLLWVADKPLDYQMGGGYYGNNVWYSRTAKPPTWRAQERTPLSAVRLDEPSVGPLTVTGIRKEMPAAPGMYQAAAGKATPRHLVVERGRLPYTAADRQPYGLFDRLGKKWKEAVLRRKDYPEDAWKPTAWDRGVYRDVGGRPLAGMNSQVTNLDFYKKTSSWLLREA